MPETKPALQMSSLHKAAIFMVSIGPKVSSQIFRHLAEDEIEVLSAEIAKLETVPSTDLAIVDDEFHQMILAQEYITAGGFSFAQEVLENALGEGRALEIIRRVQTALQVKGFNVLENVDLHQLLAFLQKEHPQTIALVLSQMTPGHASNILTELAPSMQIDVVFRIAKMDRVSPETLSAVEKVLESHIDFSQGSSKFGGVKSAAEMLNQVGARFEKHILSRIARENPDMAIEIKNLMFVFEDIINLDDRSIQKVLKEVDNRELAMGLKLCSDDLRVKILDNMSKRASDMIVEELEYMGPVRLSEVEEVQQRIVDIIRRLEDEGEIIVSTGSLEDQMI